MYRLITTETTDEQILAPIKKAKQALLEFVTEEIDGEYLKGDHMVALAQAVVNAEALANAAMGYAMVVRSEATVERKMEYIIQHLTQSPDDEWSGRKNDSKRAANDVVRAFYRDQFDGLRMDRD